MFLSVCLRQIGEEPVRPGSPAQTLHYLYRRGGLAVRLQERERERGGPAHQDGVSGPDARSVCRGQRTFENFRAVS